MEMILPVFLVAILTLSSALEESKPNIVFIVADDLGWNDVSFHGSDQILTPNIDLLAHSGVALGRYYSHAVCTPSRSAFLTGKYSHKIGMQGHPLRMTEDRGIPISEKLLPQYLKEAGYATHLVGKWHVGSSRNQYMPTLRGFDSYFGHLGGFIDYYEHTMDDHMSFDVPATGYGLYRNMSPTWGVEGYITDVYTQQATSIIEKHDKSSPLFLVVAHNAPHAGGMISKLQAPPETVRLMRHIELTPRRMFGAMVKKLDDSVGDIFKALYEKEILNDTIVVFVSDNGGRTTGSLENIASNYPLRGIKMSPFEGGIRVVGLMWSARLRNADHFWNGYMHVADWMPTLLTAAGIELPSNIDGISQWESVNANGPSNRTVMYEINDCAGFGSIIYGQYKLVIGNIPRKTGTHQGSELRGIIGEAPSYTDAIQSSTTYKVLELFGRPVNAADLNMRNNTIVHCNSTAKTLCIPNADTACLFNIIDDPCEITDLSASHPELVTNMKTLLEKEISTRMSRKCPADADPLALPKLHNYTWGPWISDSKV